MSPAATHLQKLAEAMNRVPAFADRSPFLNPSPWPLFVRYEAGRTVYVPRDRFYFSDPDGPSACLWIVPGTGEN